MHQKTQNHFLKFSIHFSVRKSRENYRQIYGKSKASLWRNLSTGTPPNFLGQSFALQLQFTIDILFRTAVLRKLFDIRFSYKHCYFSRVQLPTGKDGVENRDKVYNQRLVAEKVRAACPFLSKNGFSLYFFTLLQKDVNACEVLQFLLLICFFFFFFFFLLNSPCIHLKLSY